jgi:membrane glycosyltransferase
MMQNAQPDREPCGPDAAPFYSPVKSFWRRVYFFSVVAFASLLICLWLADLFWGMNFQKAHYPMLLVFMVLSTLLVLGSLHAVFGFFARVTSERSCRVRITRLADHASESLKRRHVVVIPVYNEDSTKVCARLEAIYRSIETTGQLEAFDFFLLSDTRNADLWVLEEVSWANLCRKLNAFGRIYYRRRIKNENRKAGNIGDFVRTWGGRYESMLVLDADSLMAGPDIVTMTRVMEAHPGLGILQTPPRLIRGNSVFTRLQQFAMGVYGPNFIRGLNFWQLGGGSYWGHNALIRIKPFSEFCELPALPGKEPFGGRILSHDFVEAALMGSRGWEVWLAWDIKGTYEEAPPTLVDHLIRDRRWCQGNLQHLWLVFARKLPFTTRVHLFMGIMAYVASPIWFLFLAIGTWIAWDRVHSGLSLLPFETYAMRLLHINGSQQSLILTSTVFGLLFVPKILGFVSTILDREARRAFGGPIRILFSGLLEIIVSILIAPSVMVSHTLMVVSILLGRSVGWEAQNRETDGTSWSDAFRFHAVATGLGITWTYLAFRIGPDFALWISPILAGLVFAAPVSVWTSRTRYGIALRDAGLLLVPEETSPPDVMKLADSATGSLDPALDASTLSRRGFVAAVVDPYVNGVHNSLLEPEEISQKLELMAQRCLAEGPEELEAAELSELMYSNAAMLLMHRRVWLQVAEGMHPVWQRAIDSYRQTLDFAAAERIASG